MKKQITQIRHKQIIVRKGVLVPPFLRHPPVDPACPLFKIFVSSLPSFLFHPLLRYFRQFLPLSRNPLQGFIQALTDLRLPEGNVLELDPLKQKVIKTAQTTCREPYLFFFFTFRSHQRCKKSVQKRKKRPKKKDKIRSPKINF